MLSVWNVMSREVLTLTRSMSVREAGRLLLEHHVHGAPVVDGAGRVHGVVSLVDITAALLDRPDATLTELIGGRDAVTAQPTDGLYEAALDMVCRDIHRLVVVDGEGRPIGMVTPVDVLRAVVALESGFHVRKTEPKET